MSAYYNEIDPFAAAWLRNLIAAGHIAQGVVDERSIEDVLPGDLDGFTQCHFFAGIGGWSLALRLAGWRDTESVWTGSCPCQPFSAAGKGGGLDDPRHLWPAWHHLIACCRPPVVFGEQVASKDALGWWDVVHADLEDAGYACAAVDLCAAGVGAPHIRQRLYWLADDHHHRRPSAAVGQLRPDSGRAEPGKRAHAQRAAAERGSEAGCMGDAGGSRSPEQRRGWIEPTRPSEAGRLGDASGLAGPVLAGFWRDADWVACRDGKARPVEPGIEPLAHGAPARVGRLRAYGNAIVPQVAAEVIRAYMECRP